jgi:hypothetical protein
MMEAAVEDYLQPLEAADVEISGSARDNGGMNGCDGSGTDRSDRNY